MKAEDQNMDDQFRKVAGEIKFPYRAEFWNEVESQLADDSMDSAFQKAAGSHSVIPAFSFKDDIADAYLDDAFNTASNNFEAKYDSAYWQEFLQNESVIEQDLAFNAAANALTTDYHATYWTDADIALQNEGLHYEYQTAFWNEARQLLDKSDRRIFFVRWASVASILLLLSLSGVYYNSISHNAFDHVATLKNGSVGHGFLVNGNENLFSVTNTEMGSSSSSQTDAGLQGSSDESTVIFDVQIQNEQFSNNDDNNFADNNISPDDIVVQQEFQPDTEMDNTPAVNADNDVLTSDGLSDESQIDSLMQNTSEDIGFSLIKNQVRPNEIITEKPVAPLVEIKKLELTPTHQLSFVVNAGLGNKYNKVDFMPSLRTSFGFEYMRTSYGRFHNFEFGGSVTMNHARQKDFGTERRVSVFNAEGGVDKFWYKLQLKDMIYTNVSGIVSMNLNQRQKVRLSFGLDYLMFVQSNMSYQDDLDKGITTVNNNWGVKDGLSKLDLTLGAGYQYQFSQRFTGMANASLGFLDRTDDIFIEKSFFDQEMSVTLGVKYTFLQKSR